jgi:hypothetical protein
MGLLTGMMNAAGYGKATKTANRVTDLLAGLDSLKGQQSSQGQDMSDLDKQILDLQMQAIDARYGGGGGSGRTLNLPAPPALKSYGGPSLENLQGLKSAGAQNIAQEYSALGQSLRNTGLQTAGVYQQSGGELSKDYGAAKQAISDAQAKAQAAIQAATSSAGEGAGQAAQAAVQQALARQQMLVASNQNQAQSSLDRTSSGQAQIARDLIAGKAQQGEEAKFRFAQQMGVKEAEARAQMAQIATANQDIMNQYNENINQRKQQFAASQAAASSRSSGAAQAAKLNLLAGVLKKQESAQKSAQNKPLTGLQGVLRYAQQQGNVPLAKQFIDMVKAATLNSTNINTESKAARASGQIKPTTTPAEQLQQLISGRVPAIDINDRNLDARGEILNLIKGAPELSGLKKYIVLSPDQARQAGEYQAAFGRSPESYNQEISKRQNQMRSIGMSGKNPVQDFTNEMNARFTPFVNLNAIRSGGDAKILNKYIRQLQDQQDMMEMFNQIYGGHFGGGLGG